MYSLGVSTPNYLTSRQHRLTSIWIFCGILILRLCSSFPPKNHYHPCSNSIARWTVFTSVCLWVCVCLFVPGTAATQRMCDEDTWNLSSTQARLLASATKTSVPPWPVMQIHMYEDDTTLFTSLLHSWIDQCKCNSWTTSVQSNRLDH